ncbi:hypothetical protein JCM14467A_01080 [Vulcanisaeta sp. JCM 14467]
MGQGDGQLQVGGLTFKAVINEPAKHLFRLMVLDETHALIFGAIGTGKTTLIKNALVDVPQDYTVVVFDIAGSYEGYTDYHAPYPLNPLDFLGDMEFLDVLDEVLTMRFPRLPYAKTPAMDYTLMLAYRQLMARGGEPSVGSVLRFLEEAVEGGTIVREDEASAARGLIRRLSYFNHWIFQKTHPLINRLLKGELRGRSIGIDLRWLTPVQRWFYVLSLLTAANAVDARNVIFVIDEAHLYFRLGESTLTFSVRVGRNYGRYFALITQSLFDVPEEFISMNKLFIEFPIMFHRPENVIFREVGFKAYFGRNEFYGSGKDVGGLMPPHWASPLTALMHLHVTSRQLLEMTAERRPYYELRVEVNPTIPPRTGATTLRQCAKAYGVDLGVIRDRGFDYTPLQQLLQGVWECIGMP